MAARATKYNEILPQQRDVSDHDRVAFAHINGDVGQRPLATLLFAAICVHTVANEAICNKVPGCGYGKAAA